MYTNYCLIIEIILKDYTYKIITYLSNLLIPDNSEI